MFQKFSLTAQQPKLQNSCSQMWLIEQLYIELGIDEKRFFVIGLDQVVLHTNINMFRYDMI